MIKKMNGFVCAVLCLFFEVSFVAAAPLSDSTLWPGYYEGDELPYNDGAGQWSVLWFKTTAGTETAYEISEVSVSAVPGEAGNSMITISNPGAIWYQASRPIMFDFAAGASVEWRFKSYSGNTVGQNFISLYDYNLNKNVRFMFSYPGTNPTGLITFCGLEYSFAMHSSVPGNTFHTFRINVLGDVAKLYIDNNPTAVLTGVTKDGGTGSNGLSWGDKLMQSDFDYVRWTMPVPEPEVGAAEPGYIMIDGQRTFPMGWFKLGYLPGSSPFSLVSLNESDTHNFDYLMHYEVWPPHGNLSSLINWMDEAHVRNLKVMITLWPLSSSFPTWTLMVNAVKDHPALYGYYLEDEPDSRGLDVADLKDKYNEVKLADPNHLIFTSYGRRLSEITPYLTATDIAIKELYPGDYVSRWGEVANDVATAKARGVGYLVIPRFWTNTDTLPFTPAEFRFITFSAIADGAGGIMPFLFEGWVLGGSPIPNSREDYVYPTTDVVAEIADELAMGLTGGLGAASVAFEANQGAYVMGGNSEGSVLVAVNHGPVLTNVAFEVSGLPPEIIGATVLGESRTILLTGPNNDQLVDSFDATYGVHVYSFNVTPCQILIDSGQGIPGDFSHDCRINWKDFSIFLERWLDDCDPMQDSSNWTGSWEGTTLPYDGGASQFGVYWFANGSPDNTNFEIANTVLDSAGFLNINTTGASGDQNLWYTKAVTFDFDAGVSVEWRFRSHYGTANSGQNFLSLYDSAQDENIFMNLQYPNGEPGTHGTVNFLDQSMPIGMKWDVEGNDFHTFRLTALGGVASLYVDDNPVAALTTTVGTGIVYGTGSGLEWGDKLMQSDFDYVRWTTQGAFAPFESGFGCELLWNGVEQDMNGDYSVDVLDLYEWIKVWLNCNDPTGCP